MTEEKEYIVWVRCSAEVPYVVTASSAAEARQSFQDSVENGDSADLRQLSSHILWDGPDDEPSERTVVELATYFGQANS